MPTLNPTDWAGGPESDEDAGLLAGPSFDDYATLEEALAAESALYASLLREGDECAPTLAPTSG